MYCVFGAFFGDRGLGDDGDVDVVVVWGSVGWRLRRDWRARQVLRTLDAMVDGRCGDCEMCDGGT